MEQLQLLGPDSSFAGHSMAYWAQEWWDWALHLESNGGQNAFQIADGTYEPYNEIAPIGQVSGKVFFLAGVAGNTQETDDGLLASARREFDVPAGAVILVPLLNAAESLQDYAFFNPDDTATPEKVAQTLDAILATVTNVFLEIDGKAVPDIGDYFVKTGFFSLGVVETGQLGTDPDAFNLQPPDVEHDPAMAAGYWVGLRNFGRGEHTLHFGGGVDLDGNGSPDFNIDITDTIRVVASDHHGSDRDEHAGRGHGVDHDGWARFGRNREDEGHYGRWGEVRGREDHGHGDPRHGDWGHDGSGYHPGHGMLADLVLA